MINLFIESLSRVGNLDVQYGRNHGLVYR